MAACGERPGASYRSVASRALSVQAISCGPRGALSGPSLVGLLHRFYPDTNTRHTPTGS